MVLMVDWWSCGASLVLGWHQVAGRDLGDQVADAVIVLLLLLLLRCCWVLLLLPLLLLLFSRLLLLLLPLLLLLLVMTGGASPLASRLRRVTISSETSRCTAVIDHRRRTQSAFPAGCCFIASQARSRHLMLTPPAPWLLPEHLERRQRLGLLITKVLTLSDKSVVTLVSNAPAQLTHRR
jgi:hypothetical protein